MGKIVTKSVDMNANILYLKNEIVADTSKTQARIEFRNMAYGTITAVKFEVQGYNAFGDVIQIAGKPTFDIVAQDLVISPKKYAKLDSVLPSKDIRKLDLKLKQVCYANGKIVNVQPEEIVTYELEELDGAKGQLEYEAKNILEKKTAEAKCFPKRYGRDWICICGYLNKNTDAICKKCGCKQVDVFETCTEEAVSENIKWKKEQAAKRETEERIRKEEEKRRLEEQRIKQELVTRQKKKKNLIIIATVGIIIAISGSVIGINTYKNKYCLSNDELQKYTVAQENYESIKEFSDRLENKLNDAYYQYDTVTAEEKEKILNNNQYIKLRSLYLGSGDLYSKLQSQYPEKYKVLYENLAYLMKKNIICTAACDKYSYEGNNSLAESFQKTKNTLENEINRIEEYMEKTAINTEKVEFQPVPSVKWEPLTDGTTVGIVYFDDGQIRYIGEYKNDKAEGYGILWEETENGKEIKHEGQFKDGRFVGEE